MATAVGPLLLLTLMMSSVAQAQAPMIDMEGLRGGRHVGSAAPLSAAPRLVAGLGYAYTEGVLDGSDRHHRAFGEVAAGYAVRQYLQVALGFQGRYDAHRSDVSGRDGGAAFSTALTTRHAFSLTDALSLGGQLRLRFPAAKSLARGLSAVSPELSLLVTHTFAPTYELSSVLGYRFDRSRESVADPNALSAADRLAASLSRFNAALLGLLFAMPLGPATASVEWSWDIPSGSGKPPVGTAPMRFRVAAQRVVAERYVPGIELGISPSARGDAELLARIEPRFWAAATIALLFDAPAPVARRALQTVPEVLPPAEPLSVALRVVDSTGEPVAAARIKLGSETESLETQTNGEGVALIVLPAEGAQQLSIEAEGFEPYAAEISSASPPSAWSVTLARVLPEGEIKGKVRSLRGGRPLRARVVVQPLGLVVETDDQGNFVTAVPPGQYALEISAEGHEPQERPAQVEKLGVTILVVDLRRVTK
jgi:hypothetical protein